MSYELLTRVSEFSLHHKFAHIFTTRDEDVLSKDKKVKKKRLDEANDDLNLIEKCCLAKYFFDDRFWWFKWFFSV